MHQTNTQTPATPDQKVADAFRKVATRLQTVIDGRKGASRIDTYDLLETMLAVADEIDPEFPANQDADSKVIATVISPSPVPQALKDAVDVLRDACEFLANDTAIRPGSEVANDLMALYRRMKIAAR